MKTLIVLATGAVMGVAQAAVVVNVPGAAGGAGTVEAVSYPVLPGAVLHFVNPVLVDLAAGDYLLTPAAVGQTPGATFAAWNFQVSAAGSWGSHFVAGVPLGGDEYSVLLDANGVPEPSCRNHFCAYDTESQALAAWLSTPAFHLHLDRATTVGFVAADHYLDDNAGGMSFTISPVPEPAAALMLAAGAAVLGLRRRLCAKSA